MRLTFGHGIPMRKSLKLLYPLYPRPAHTKYLQTLITGKISNVGRFDFIFGIEHVESNTQLEKIGKLKAEIGRFQNRIKIK